MSESDTPTTDHVAETKQFRKDLDEVLQRVKLSTRFSRERSLGVTKIEEGIMWFGMDLEAQNEGNSCYAHGYDPESPTIEPTAGGLKM